jgi:signal peptidase I
MEPTKSDLEIVCTAQEGDASSADPVDGPKPATPALPGWTLWIRDLLFSALVSVLIITFLYQPVRVEGISMLPRLEDQDRLFINKFVYHFASIERGDVVVFRYPRNPQVSYIKRIVALPGDKLRIDRGQVFVNGRPISEPYVPHEYRDAKSYDEIVVPRDEYFVLGDHRSVASDSREFGPVKRDLIYGKAAFVYWPSQDVGVVH